MLLKVLRVGTVFVDFKMMADTVNAGIPLNKIATRYFLVCSSLFRIDQMNCCGFNKLKSDNQPFYFHNRYHRQTSVTKGDIL